MRQIGVIKLEIKKEFNRTSNLLRSFLSKKRIEEVAKATGFQKRKSKLPPWPFFCLLVGELKRRDNVSLLDYCSTLKKKTGRTIARQSMDAKFSASGDKFFRTLLEEALEWFVNPSPRKDGDPVRVKIKDSCGFTCPSRMSGSFKGSGGSGPEAGIKIQFEYGMCGGVYDLSLGNMVDSDSTDAIKKNGGLSEGDLVIRDLGYLSIKALEKIEGSGAFYISRLKDSNIYEKVDGKYKRLYYKDLYKKSKKGKVRDLEVYIGSVAKQKTRLLVERVPKATFDERMERLYLKSKKSGYKVTPKNKLKQRLNLLITNTDIPAESVRQIYRIRWQIELVFKTWKSYDDIDKIKDVKEERVLMELYARLIWIVMTRPIEEAIIQWGERMGCSMSMMKIRKSLSRSRDTVWEKLAPLFSNLLDDLREIKRLFKRSIRKVDGKKENWESEYKKLKNNRISKFI